MQEFQDVLRYLRRRLYLPPPYYHEAVAHYCVNCGVPLETRTLEGRQVESCPRCSFALWHDPKVVTLAVVENDRGEVVLGRRGIEPGYGLWCLPGGYVNDDE